MENKEKFYEKIIPKMITEKFYYWFIVLTMTIVPLAELITECFGKSFMSQSMIISVAGGIGLASLMFYFYYRIREGFSYTDIFVCTLTLFMIISMIFSQDYVETFIGDYYDELPMQFMTYFSLMFAGTMIKDCKLRKKILCVFCAVALLQGIVSVLQTTGIQICDSQLDPEWHRTDHITYGLTQHNNFYAGLSILFVGASLGMYLFSKGKIQYIYLILTGIMFYTSICSGARISWVGNSMIILFYIISFITARKRTDKKTVLKFVSACIMCIAILGFIYLIKPDVLLSGANDFSREFADSASIEGMGSNRIYIWKHGLQMVPKYWLTGVGLDNYIFAFTNNPNWDGAFHQHKGHNEYIHTLVTEGVPALINYIALLIYVCSNAVKNILNNKDEENVRITWIFLGMFAGYAAQACFNSSVINVAMYFWITIGMVAPKSNQKIMHFKMRNISENNM